ncbi:hypothetical protein CYMTET_29896, partial [Cymbomonas tetramitiformis]
MPDYVVKRVASEEEDEVWHVATIKEGLHPGELRMAIKDPDVFWPSGKSYSDRKRNAFFKAQRANLGEELCQLLLDLFDRLQVEGVQLTAQGSRIKQMYLCRADLHELDSGFCNPMLKSEDGHATLVMVGVQLYEGREDEGAVRHHWLALALENGAYVGVDIACTQFDIF